jgi:hypothetical protein
MWRDEKRRCGDMKREDVETRREKMWRSEGRRCGDMKGEDVET